MKLKNLFNLSWAAAVALLCSCATIRSQQSFYQQFRHNNASMTEVQPTWMTPLIQSDARLGQAVRFSVSNSTMAGNHVLNYGNGRGISMIAGRRFQIDIESSVAFPQSLQQRA